MATDTCVKRARGAFEHFLTFLQLKISFILYKQTEWHFRP